VNLIASTLLALATGGLLQSGEQGNPEDGLRGYLICPQAQDLSGIEVLLWETGVGGTTTKARAESDGSFAFTRKPQDAAWLLVDDWRDSERRLWSAARQLPAGATDASNLELKKGALLHGRVVDADGKAAALAVIDTGRRTISPHDPEVSARGIATNEHGAFACVAPSGYWYVGGKLPAQPKLRIQQELLRLPHDGRLVLRVPRTVRISGLVVDEQGRGVSGALVRIASGDPFVALLASSNFSEVRTDETGAFVESGLQGGELTLSAHLPGHAPSAEHRIRVARVGEWPITVLQGIKLQLRQGAVLEVRRSAVPSTEVAAMVVEYELLDLAVAQSEGQAEPHTAGRLELSSEKSVAANDLPPGLYSCRVMTRYAADARALGSGSVKSENRFIKLAAGEQHVFLLDEPQPLPIVLEGRFVSRSSQSGSNLEVALGLTPDGTAAWRLQVDSTGRFRGAVPFPGHYWATCAPSRDTGVTTLVWPLDLSSAKAEPLMLVVPEGAVAFRCVLPEAFIEQAEADAERFVRFAVERLDGGEDEPRPLRGKVHAIARGQRGRAYWLPPGRYRMSIEEECHSSATGRELLAAECSDVLVSASGASVERTFHLLPVPSTATFEK